MKPEPNWAAIIPPNPPRLRIRSEHPRDRAPVRVFGFPITHETRRAWADRFNIQPDAQEIIRAQLAWKHICSLLPLARRRAGAVYHGREENVPNHHWNQ